MPLRGISSMTACSFTTLPEANQSSRTSMDDNAQPVVPLINRPLTLGLEENLRGPSGELATVGDQPG